MKVIEELFDTNANLLKKFKKTLYVGFLYLNGGILMEKLKIDVICNFLVFIFD